jgi:hypothetical protein
MTPEAIDTPRTMEQLSIEAAQAHAKPNTIAETDRGIHKDPIDRMCDELIAAGWRSAALHPRSPIWISPHDGLRYPLGGAYSLMKEKQQSL